MAGFNIPECLVLIHRGEQVGTVSATFNFDNLPPEFHSLAVMALNRTINLHTHAPVTEEEAREDQEYRDALVAWLNRPWWRKLFCHDPEPTPP
jgi:hypothetical protein